MASCKIVINGGKKIIEAESGMKLIDALSGQGIYLPSACGSTGKCGLCKVKATNVAQQFTSSEMAQLTDAEKDESVHLACQLTISDGLEIELPVEFLTTQEFASVLKKKVFLTKDMIELTLNLTSPSKISFHAGQYIILKMPPHGDKKAAMRPFSIASSNADQSHIQLVVKLNQVGIVTPWIFNELMEGQEVRFNGPRGNFFIRNTLKPMIFIAGGSGMAPVRSILKTMGEHGSSRSALFFFGAQTQNDLFYLDEMEQLKSVLDNFDFIPTLSKEPMGSDWKGERGWITEVMDRIVNYNLSNHEAYLCGRPAMIDGCIPILDKKNIQKEQVYFDLFNSPKQTNK